jgi:hypothetical protein
MQDVASMSDEELGMLVRAAVGNREHELKPAMQTRESFSDFLIEVGLLWLADVVMSAAEAWRTVKRAIRDFFCEIFS